MKYILTLLKIIASIVLALTGLFWFAISYFLDGEAIFILPLLLCMFCWYCVAELLKSLFKGLEDKENETNIIFDRNGQGYFGR